MGIFHGENDGKIKMCCNHFYENENLWVGPKCTASTWQQISKLDARKNYTFFHNLKWLQKYKSPRFSFIRSISRRLFFDGWRLQCRNACNLRRTHLLGNTNEFLEKLLESAVARQLMQLECRAALFCSLAGCRAINIPCECGDFIASACMRPATYSRSNTQSFISIHAQKLYVRYHKRFPTNFLVTKTAPYMHWLAIEFMLFMSFGILAEFFSMAQR